MHILVVNDDGPPSAHSSPYVHSLVRELQAAGHTVSVCLPHTQRSWIGKAHMIGQTLKPVYYRPPPLSSSSSSLPAGLGAADDEHAHGSTHPRPSTDGSVEEWVLVDGTPASCVQIGLYHFFGDRGDFDLVVSGPNYGRNTTAVFALSSGTLGGALEAAACGKRAVALSYAFFSRNHDPEIVAGASRHSVRVIEALVRDWPDDKSVDVYSVNVPLVEGVEKAKTVYAPCLQNYWTVGNSAFEPVYGEVDEDEEEERIRKGEMEGEEGRAESNGEKKKGHEHRLFKWAPKLADVMKATDEAAPSVDGRVVKAGNTSVTALKANFWHAATHLHEQELKLDVQESTTSLPVRTAKDRDGTPEDLIYAIVDYEDAYVQPTILAALQSLIPPSRLRLLPASSSTATLPQGAKFLQIRAYESIDFDYAMTNPSTSLINSYIIRKALIRKHFLDSTVDHWVAKHPESILRKHVKRGEAFEVDYAEFLEDALVEAWDLRAALEKNEEVGAQADDYAQAEAHAQAQAQAQGCVDGDRSDQYGTVHVSSATGEQKDPKGRDWWILKPSMSDRGQGIRLFSTMEELQGIFDGWEADEPPSDDEFDDEEQEHESGNGGNHDDDDDDDHDATGGITASHLRHFVAQPYIHPPLLLPSCDNRKFHIRTYVLCAGAMRVYVCREMLALFAARPYSAPWEKNKNKNKNKTATATTTTAAGLSDDEDEDEDDYLDAHLTNTCLQGPRADATSVQRFWALDMAPQLQDAIFQQICAVTGEIFEAAARGMMVHFQPLPFAFEAYGLDYLVDSSGNAWLLEVNAFPDFKQTGEELRDSVVAEFWKGVARWAVGPWAGLGDGDMGHQERMVGGDDGMILVRDVDLGRR